MSSPVGRIIIDRARQCGSSSIFGISPIDNLSTVPPLTKETFQRYELMFRHAFSTGFTDWRTLIGGSTDSLEHLRSNTEWYLKGGNEMKYRIEAFDGKGNKVVDVIIRGDGEAEALTRVLVHNKHRVSINPNIEQDHKVSEQMHPEPVNTIRPYQVEQYQAEQADAATAESRNIR